MQSERQIMDTILSVVKSSDNIRAAYMNGSRTNPNVEKDELRDYDILFSVNDVRRMINGRKWLKTFGDIAINYAGAGQRGYGMGRECRP